MNARANSETDLRVPGDPTYCRRLYDGELPMPSLVTARARWDARQAGLISNSPMRARMLLPIIDQIIAEFGPRLAEAPLTELRNGLASILADGDGDE